MKNDTDAMRDIGSAVETSGTDIGADVDTASDSLDAVSGNDGFQTVAAMQDAASTWTAHVKGIGTTLADIGSNVSTAANDFDDIDGDNAENINQSASGGYQLY